MPNQATTQYLAACQQPGSQLATAARQLRLPETYAGSYGELLLDRPVLAPHEELEGFAADLSAVFDLLVSLPHRLFGGDLGAYCAAVRLDPRLTALALHGATGEPPLHGRVDAYHDGTAFRLLEFNLGSELGGTDAAQLNRSYLEVASVQRFSDRMGLGFIDTASRVATALREAARSAGLADEPTVALIESRGGLAGHRHVFSALQEAMRLHGVDLLLGEIHELGERNGKLLLHGRPLDVVLRYFVAGELADDPSGSELLDAVVRAHESGRTRLFTPLEAGLYASKAALALLHDPQTRATYTNDERLLVDRIVPWTRLLVTAADHEEVVERCRADQSSLLIKPGVGYGGTGTVPGWAVDERTWQSALHSAAPDTVVQQRINPVPEPVFDPEDGTVRDWVANWGVFVDQQGYAGAFVRALRPEDGAVVSYSNPGTRGTCVFTYSMARESPDGDAARI
ncbi:hypothetical protein [Geodermatophilus sp. DSM 45219]|uniref:hypothetical protein n=1 Tax=Geodermatophilus sp. DSM 45219 TaxID=1881103 RepID=UPI0008908C12|nr:hypothetical protein [Geodermatophilus sp. DSM 45219]SDN52903.1 hypothetical protein SAMN05428965_0798 [Geodermatophilus sp. DSM 45219]